MNIFVGKSYLPLKRLIDIVGSLVAILLFSPVMILVAWKVRQNLGSPVIFTQERPGKDERIFKIFKFRTMKDGYSKDGTPLPDATRLVPFGEKLRASSLDELPELFNVLLGQMSLVGPRPLRVHYLPLYNEKQRRRHNMRPGITGWAQVNGRNALSWENKFELDLFYVENASLWMDIQILAKTILSVIRKNNINTPGSKSSLPFLGTIKE